VLAQVAVIPGAPLLVPELTGPGAVEAEPVRAAAGAAITALAAACDRWIVLCAADAPCPPGADSPRSGDFGRFGCAVPVTLPGRAPLPLPAGPVVAEMPAGVLVAGWLAQRTAHPPARLQPRLIAPDAPGPDCAAFGARLADELRSVPDPLGVLVVADGATALSPSAPGGGERERAWALQRRLDAAVAAGDPAALAGLETEACRAEGLVAAPWHALAALCGDRPDRVEVHYTGAPFGVGYTVASWLWTRNCAEPGQRR